MEGDVTEGPKNCNTVDITKPQNGETNTETAIFVRLFFSCKIQRNSKTELVSDVREIHPKRILLASEPKGPEPHNYTL